ncbi:MAG: rod shape-determining protein MreC [Lentimicrobiaceae bacterium]|nr:rod shape-determining protein MreC [Lentimicrobiaceae bacterium]
MRNILDFLYRFRFFLLFITLEAISIVLVVRNNGYQQSIVLTATSRFTGRIQQSYERVMSYFSLRYTNEALMAENALLRAQLRNAFFEDSRTMFYQEDSMFMQRFTYLPADVIRNTSSRRNNYIVIDRGRKHGVEKNMGVFTSDGVVGIIRSVSDHYASALSVLHNDVRISSKIKRNGYVGTFRWEGGDVSRGWMTEVPGHVDLQAGDTIVTSGYSLIFPAGIPVGTIEDFELKEDEHFYKIRIKIAVDFRRMDHVYVVKDLMRNEFKELKEPVNE